MKNNNTWTICMIYRKTNSLSLIDGIKVKTMKQQSIFPDFCIKKCPKQNFCMLKDNTKKWKKQSIFDIN